MEKPYKIKGKNKMLGMVVATLLFGISVTALAEEAGDSSVFSETGQRTNILEESSLMRKQLEQLLSSNKKSSRQHKGYKSPEAVDKKSPTEAVKTSQDEKASMDAATSAADDFSKSIQRTALEVRKEKTEPHSVRQETSLGRRFLERYYASTGRSYSDTPRQLDKLFGKPRSDQSENLSPVAQNGVGEDINPYEGKHSGKQFLERYKAENEPGEPLIMRDPALSDYPERSIDCQYLDYESGSSSIIFVKPGFKTDILLPAGDKLERITCGDRQRFDITTYYDKSECRWHVYIQPYQHDITTNIIISTDRHNFQSRLETTELLKPYVRWNLPDDISAGYKDRNVVMDVENVKDLNFAYAHSGKISADWAPMNVFDDKYWKTYLSFEKNKLQRINPVILARAEDGSMVIVPYDKRGDILVMNKVYTEFDVRVGSHSVSYKRIAR